MLKRKDNIILTGFMGCGKSSIGRRIAANFEINFIDTDIRIQEMCGMSISDIFKKYGEDYFRRLERNYCKLISMEKGCVIATGGGVIKDFSNVENLKINGVVVYMKCSPEKIYNNIKDDTTRPLLSGVVEKDKFNLICAMMEERRSLYERRADFIIDISNMRLEESAWQVGRELRRLGFI